MLDFVNIYEKNHIFLVRYANMVYGSNGFPNIEPILYS